MEYYCEDCDIFIKLKCKQIHIKSKTHKKLDKCELIVLSLKHIDINTVDEAFFSYIIEHKKNSIIIL